MRSPSSAAREKPLLAAVREKATYSKEDPAQPKPKKQIFLKKKIALACRVVSLGGKGKGGGYLWKLGP